MYREQFSSWRAPEHWHRITSIDAHTEGEPLRIIVSGYPRLEGDTILEKRASAHDKWDYFRTALMWEPRGHADMYGCLITPPERPDSDFGVIFLHNEGYSTMCGHGIIAVATVVVQTGLMPATGPETTIRIDSPAGLIVATAHSQEGAVTSASFENVPSFALDLDASVEVPGLGQINYDLAFGGAFYACLDVTQVGLTCGPESHSALVAAGKSIKAAIAGSREIEHPDHPDLGFLYGTIFIEPSENPGVHSRNVCVFADGEVDRSPTGTGVSARLAIHHARGEVAVGEEIVIESIISSSFSGSVVGVTSVADHEAVIPRVQGRAFITGQHIFFADPSDPLANGFNLR